MMWLVFLCIIFLGANRFLFLQFPKAPLLQLGRMYDICIVLGCPTNEDGSLSRIQTSRMKKAVELYDQHKVKKMLISGGSVHNPFIEAEIMAAYALQHGVDKKDIICECDAQNTYDNLRLSKSICENLHVKQVVIVTSCFHVRRANFFVRKFFDFYVMVGTDEHEKFRYYLNEYIRMWNTLRIEYNMKRKS